MSCCLVFLHFLCDILSGRPVILLQNTATWSAYAEDLKYLVTNKTFMMITVGFTALTFFTGECDHM